MVESYDGYFSSAHFASEIKYQTQHSVCVQNVATLECFTLVSWDALWDTSEKIYSIIDLLQLFYAKIGQIFRTWF